VNQELARRNGKLTVLGAIVWSMLVACEQAPAPGPSAEMPAPASTPNILVIMADDMGYTDIGSFGGEIETPNIDALAAEGMRFTDAHSPSSVCSPTRYGILTGRYAWRTWLPRGVVGGYTPPLIEPGRPTVASFLRDNGYATAMVGKWHLGHAQETYHPNRRGFEHFYGHLHTEVGYFPPFSNPGGKDFQRNGVSIDDQGYESFLLADEASRYIRERDKERPFFLYMPFIAPHTPLDAPADLVEKYKDLEDDRQPARSVNTDRTRMISKLMLRGSARPRYAAVVEGMDRAIGKVLDTLDEQGLAENTIVLFFSDNGGAAYALGGADNVPLRGGKGETFEGGIRVVAVMRWPAKLKAGTKNESIMSVMDVFPTLAEAAGVEVNAPFDLDGRSLWPALSAGKKQPREDYLFFGSETPLRGTKMLTAFNDEWKLVQEIDQGLLSANVTTHLFKISDDPNEHHNLAASHPKVVAEMSDAILEWRSLYPVSGTRSQLVPPPGWRAPLDWVNYPVPIAALQEQPAPGMPPAFALPILDYQHGEAGRLIYDCEPYALLGGGLCK